MQDSTTMQQAPVSQPSSIPSSVVAPSAAYPQAVAPSAPASYPTAPAASPELAQPQAQVAQANPWQAAYSSLLASLNTPASSQPQAASWAQTQPVAQPAVSSPVAQPYPQAVSPSAMPTSWPQATPAYAPAQAPSSQSQPSDGYLASVSNESLEVLSHFGAEAPALLNRYACVVEDALLNQAQQTATALQQIEQINQQLADSHSVIKAAAEDNAAYHTLLTNPNLLADYVTEFYGPNGPYPTETATDRLRAEVEAGEQRFAPMPTVSSAPAQQQQFQRPQLEMPAPGAQAPAANDFWATFSAVADRNPAEAWKIISAASPEDLRSKILISDG